MKKCFLIFVAAFAAIAVCCTKNELTPYEPNCSYTEFVATIGDEVKTDLNASTGKVSWAEGDAIKIIWKTEEGLQTAVSESLTAEGAAAQPVKFRAECSPEGDTFGVYPSTLTVEKPDYLDITIPSVQNGNFSDVQILAAKLLEGKMAFKNVCGYLQFSVPAGVTKAVWTSDGLNDLAGEIQVSFPEGVFQTEGLVSGTGSKDVTVNVSGAGTYYVAVAPGTYSSLYVAMYNGTTLVGERQTFNQVEVASAQVKKMGTIPQTTLTDKYFVKVAGAGTKDGSSWDNAADINGFRTFIASAGANGKNIYMAAGTYVWTSDLSLSTETGTFKIFGGFPAGITGEALSGRDPKANETIFDGDGKYRIFVVTKPSITYDGLVFQNAYKSSTDNGVALILQSCPDQLINNCIFRNNVHAGAGPGGALRVAAASTATVTVTNSIFENNVAAGDAGAVMITSGTYISKNNIYRGNISNASGSADVGGGAVKINGAVTCIFDGDLFDCNKVPSASASAIYGFGGAYSIQCHNTVFINNRASTRGCLRSKSSTGKVYLDACTFARDTVSSYGSALQLNSPSAVHNCVFHQNINMSGTGASNIYHDANLLFSNSTMRLGGKSTTGIWHKGGINSVIVNSIIYNNGADSLGNAGSSINMEATKDFTSYGHNIIGMFNADDTKSPLINNTSNFVLNDSAHPDYFYTCKLDEEGNKSWNLDPQYIDAPYYLLKWTSWPAPGKPDTYSQTTAARVEAAIDAFDAATSMGVKAWLNSIGSLNADRRGTLRSATGLIWPGSYDNSATSTL